MANCTIMRFKAWPAIRSFDIAAIPKMNVPFQLPYNREQKHVLQFRKSDFFVV